MAIDDSTIERTVKGFGLSYLYPYQRLVIANVLDACAPDADAETPRHQAVILPTGAGKSLCFQLPAALLPGPSLVVFPLLGLQADQMRRLERSGVAAVSLCGGMTRLERGAALEAIRGGRAKLVLTNPETLLTERTLSMLSDVPISHFVIDEAHCVAEWGDGFRPAYRRLGEAIEKLKPAAVTAFTATASPAVLGRLAELIFGARPYRVVTASVDRPNIAYEVRRALSMKRALRTAAREAIKPAIVFARSRKGVELLAEDLAEELPETDLRFYHAGLTKEERSAVESWFLKSKNGMLCATTAYGMGMDKGDIRTVIHFGAPATIESYLQESGRAGRDGEAASAILLAPVASASDARGAGSGAIPEALGHGARGALPSPRDEDSVTTTVQTALTGREQLMAGYAEGGYGCRRAYLLRAMDDPGADEIGCSSCDVCRGIVPDGAEGERELAAALRAHRRRFDARGLAMFVRGCHGRSTTGAPGDGMSAAHSGCLAHWKSDEPLEAIFAAISAGIALEAGHWPWKGRLSPAPRLNPQAVRRLVPTIQAPEPTRPSAEGPCREASVAAVRPATGWLHSLRGARRRRTRPASRASPSARSPWPRARACP